MNYRNIVRLSFGRNIIIVAFVTLLAVSTGCQSHKEEIGESLEIGVSKGAMTAEELYTAPSGTELLRVGEATVNKGELRDSFMALYAKPAKDEDPKQVSGRVIEYVLARNYLSMEAIQRGLEIDENVWARYDSRMPFWLGDYYFDKLSRELDIDKVVIEAMIPEVLAVSIHQIVSADLGKAQELRAKALEGADFEGLAREFGIDPAAPNGGLMKTPRLTGGFDGLYEQELVERIARTEVGGITAVLKHPMGYGFFRVDAIEPVTEEALSAIRDQKAADLKATALAELKEKVLSKYPINVDEKVLEKAIGDFSDPTVIAISGDYQLTFRNFRYLFEMPDALEITERVPLHRWVDIVKGLHLNMAFYNEALAQGIHLDSWVADNMERAKKYSRAETLETILFNEAVPGVKELYQDYRKNIVTGSEPGIFSLEGVRGVAEEDCKRVADSLADGGSGRDAAKTIPTGIVYELMEGTYQDSQFSEELLLAIEKTPAGEIAGPLREADGSWSVVRVSGKRRGEAPPFDSIIGRVEKKVKRDRYDISRQRIAITWSKKEPAKFIQDKETVEGLIGLWLERQKIIVGVKSPHGPH